MFDRTDNIGSISNCLADSNVILCKSIKPIQMSYFANLLNII